MPTATARKSKTATKSKRPLSATKAKRQSPDTTREDCPHCSNGAETFRYMKRLYRFDVDKARQFVGDGREPVELEPDDVKFSVETSHIYPQHVKHVNPKFPGIIAHVWYPEPNGNVLHGHVLIDGHHRAARCLELDRPYYVYLLSEQESREVLLEKSNINEVFASIAAKK